MRDMLDHLLGRTTLLTIAAAIALGYGLLDVARGTATLVLSIFTERAGDLPNFARGPLALDVGDRTLEFAQLVAGLVTLAVVVAVIAYVLRGRSGD